MTKPLLMLMGLFLAQVCHAEKPPGFLWYNMPKAPVIQKKLKHHGQPFSQLSYQQKDAVMAYYTREAWHKAMTSQNVENMRNYLALQDFWSTRATNTSRLFEKTMLYPTFRTNVEDFYN